MYHSIFKNIQIPVLQFVEREREKERETDRQTERERETDRQTERERQTDRQADTHVCMDHT